MAMILKNNPDVQRLTTMCRPLAESNFHDKYGKFKKLVTEDYSLCMDYVNKGDRMANSYSVGEHGNGQQIIPFISWT
jgi:hypothetical protein